MLFVFIFVFCRGGDGRGRAISVYNRLRCEFEFRSWRCVFDTTFCEYNIAMAETI
jgi:hypothetical protein